MPNTKIHGLSNDEVQEILDISHKVDGGIIFFKSRFRDYFRQMLRAIEAARYEARVNVDEVSKLRVRLKNMPSYEAENAKLVKEAESQKQQKLAVITDLTNANKVIMVLRSDVVTQDAKIAFLQSQVDELVAERNAQDAKYSVYEADAAKALKMNQELDNINKMNLQQIEALEKMDENNKKIIDGYKKYNNELRSECDDCYEKIERIRCIINDE